MKNIILILLVCISMGSSAIEYNEIFVDQKNGDDLSNTGLSENSAFKTITHALSLKKVCSSIYVTGGDYSSKNGEVFPLDLPFGTKIQYLDKYSSPLVILGNGLYSENGIVRNATFVLNGNNWLKSIKVNSNYNTGVLSINGENIIQSSEFNKNSIGVEILNSSKLILKSSSLFNNSGIALKAQGDSKITLVNTSISNNNIGLSMSDESTIIFNHENKSGENFIQKNDKCDFFYNGNKDQYLDEITWDNDPFDFGIKDKCVSGNNIVNQGFGDIHYQVIPKENQLLFDAPARIHLLDPHFSEVLYSPNPTFSYNTNSNKLLMVAVWSHLPKVQDNKITNLSDIIWYWHSGMKNSPLGIVEYKDGRHPINNDLNPDEYTNDSFPVPLIKGHSYYWAVWEWDSSGLSINASSAISYFKISENTQGRSTHVLPSNNYGPKIINLAKRDSNSEDKNEIVCNDPSPNKDSSGGSVSILFVGFLSLFFRKKYLT